MILVLHPDKSVHELYDSRGFKNVFEPRRFNEIADGLRGRYVEFIEKLYSYHLGNIDWLITTVASRNTIVGQSFLDIVSLVYADEVIRTHDVSLIVCQNRGLRQALQQLIKRDHLNIKVVRHESLRKRMEQSYASYVLWGVKFLIRSFCRNRDARASRNISAGREIKGPVNLLDVFVLGNSFDGKTFRDRYYGGFRNLTESFGWVYLPYLHDIAKPEDIISKMRGADVPFLIKEDYLQLSDYLWAAGHLIRRLLLSVPDERFEVFNVKSIIGDELRFQSVFNSMEALLGYRFPMRLKAAGISVPVFFDWFENQDVDRALHAGFERYSPETRRIGYQGFVVSPFYMCVFPTEMERKAGVLPHSLAVMGRGLVEAAKVHCPELDVFVAPAFRFGGLWKDLERKSCDGFYSILVSLPIMTDESRALLGMLRTAMKSFPDNVTVSVKPHPTMSVQTIDRLLDDMKDSVRVVSGDFNERLVETDILISSTSSTCLETVARGIPVIIAGSETSITQNPVPAEVVPELWKICYSAGELCEAVLAFAAMGSAAQQQQVEQGNLVRQRYFSEVSPEALAELELHLKGKKR